jgi:glycosyltransferase involved in cell wall biosynthesis
MKILAYPSPSNARQFRLDQVGKYIMRNSQNSFYVSINEMSEQDLSVADVIILQQTSSPDKIYMAYKYAKENQKLLVAELDDGFTIQDDNPAKDKFVENEAEKWLENLCGVADVVTVTTEYLAEAVRKRLRKNGVKKDVVVLPNYLDMELWNLPLRKNHTDEIRMLWAGSRTHRNDMKFIAPVIKKICKRYPQVKFLFTGDYMLNPLFKGINSEYIDAVEFNYYPAKLNSIRADIGIAPLLNTEFNRCKSNLKSLEYGIAGMASVFSNTVYEHTVKEGETGLLAETADEFYHKIAMLIENPELRERIAFGAYNDITSNYNIQDHIHKWMDTYWYHLSKKKDLKIDVGSGIQPIIGGGYIHLDVAPTHGEMICDIKEGIPVANETVEKLICSAIIEHIYLSDLEEKVLPEFLRILKKGGEVFIVVPDWESVRKSDDWEMVQANLYGVPHDYCPAEFDLHKNIWDYPHLKKLLLKAGFSKVKKVKYTEKAHDPKFTLAVKATK